MPTDGQKGDIEIQADTGRVILAISTPDQSVELPLSPEAAVNLGADLAKAAYSAQD